MSAIIENENGKIVIDNEVIARVAGLAAMDCYGIVGMSAKSVKDDVFRLLKMESLSKGIKLALNENMVSIELHIIVKYGTNIPAIANALIENVTYKVEEYLGLQVKEVGINVEGIRVND